MDRTDGRYQEGERLLSFHHGQQSFFRERKRGERTEMKKLVSTNKRQIHRQPPVTQPAERGRRSKSGMKEDFATKAPLRILHLEDNSHDRQLVEEKLAADGLVCEFIHVAEREQFEARLEQNPFDVILSDFTLPSYDGMAALAAARKLQPEAPFLFVSGTIGEERTVEGLKLGATDFVLKGHLDRLG